MAESAKRKKMDGEAAMLSFFDVEALERGMHRPLWPPSGSCSLVPLAIVLFAKRLIHK
jgi:hypothetical protein